MRHCLLIYRTFAKQYAKNAVNHIVLVRFMRKVVLKFRRALIRRRSTEDSVKSLFFSKYNESTISKKEALSKKITMEADAVKLQNGFYDKFI